MHGLGAHVCVSGASNPTALCFVYVTLDGIAFHTNVRFGGALTAAKPTTTVVGPFATSLAHSEAYFFGIARPNKHLVGTHSDGLGCGRRMNS